MKTEERLRVCHRHAELRYLSGGRSGNPALCDRLGMDRRNAARVSGVIRRVATGPPVNLRRNAARISGMIRRFALGVAAIAGRNATRVSGVIRQARRKGLIRPADSTRLTRSGYAPFRA